MLNEILNRLSARLPELELKLSAPDIIISASALPRGLFRNQLGFTAKTCIDEIKADLQKISVYKNEHVTFYLSERVEKKINVLVKLCQSKKKTQLPEHQAILGVQAIETRQQRLKSMQQTIDRLIQQKAELETSLTLLVKENNTQAILSLQSQLGQLERQITQTQEVLKSIS